MNANGHKSEDILRVIFFCIFMFPFLLYFFFDLFCSIGVMTPVSNRKKRRRLPQAEPTQDPEWHGTWNDTPEDEWFDPEPSEPQTDQLLIDEVIAGLQNIGFKKRDARMSVLKACEGKVFEDHQSLVEAALNKSNL